MIKKAHSAERHALVELFGVHHLIRARACERPTVRRKVRNGKYEIRLQPTNTIQLPSAGCPDPPLEAAMCWSACPRERTAATRSRKCVLGHQCGCAKNILGFRLNEPSPPRHELRCSISPFVVVALWGAAVFPKELTRAAFDRMSTPLNKYVRWGLLPPRIVVSLDLFVVFSGVALPPSLSSFPRLCQFPSTILFALLSNRLRRRSTQ